MVGNEHTHIHSVYGQLQVWLLQASSFASLQRNYLGVLSQGKLCNSFIGFVKEHSSFGRLWRLVPSAVEATNLICYREKGKGFVLQTLDISKIKLNTTQFLPPCSTENFRKTFSNVRPLFLCSCQRQFQFMLVIEKCICFLFSLWEQ